MGIFDSLKRTFMGDDPSNEIMDNVISDEEIVNNISDGTAVMIITDVFTISGRGSIVCGSLMNGPVTVNTDYKINGKVYTLVGIEMNRTNVEMANVGDNVGLLFKDLTREEVRSGDIIYRNM